MSNIKYSIIHHGGSCADGFMAAWLMYHSLKEDDTEFTYELIPMHYNDPLPEIKGKHVYIVDFSLPIEELLKMTASGKSVVMLDHHKTAADLYGGYGEITKCEHIYISILEQYSGCGMVLNAILENGSSGFITPRITLVSNAIQDRDLWKFKLPNTEIICSIMRSVPMTIETWDNVLLEETDQEFNERFLRANYYHQHNLELANSMAEKATLIQFQGYTIPIVNCVQNISETGNILSNKYNMSMSYFITDTKVIVSMRSKSKEYDVASLCKIYGGGGHLSAAGFSIQIEQLKDLLEGKL